MNVLHIDALKNSNLNDFGLPLLGTLSIEGGAKGVWIADSKTFNIPKEVTKIRVVYCSVSAETEVAYRNINELKLRWRNQDHWQAKITLSNRRAIGLWGHSHGYMMPRSLGEILSERTISIQDASEHEERSFTLFVRAINVEDGLLPTRVKVDVYKF